MTDQAFRGISRRVRSALAVDKGSALPMALCALLALSGFAMSALCLIEVRARQLQIRSTADVAALASVADGCGRGREIAERNHGSMTRCIRNVATNETVVTIVSARPLGILGTVSVSASARAGYAD